MDIEWLLSFCKTKIKERPDLRMQISDVYQSAVDEINDGSSESHEVELAVDSIVEILSE